MNQRSSMLSYQCFSVTKMRLEMTNDFSNLKILCDLIRTLRWSGGHDGYWSRFQDRITGREANHKRFLNMENKLRVSGGERKMGDGH